MTSVTPADVEYKIGQYLEWFTDVPVQDEYRDSPVFFLNGNEWFIRLLSVRLGYTWYFRVSLELKNKHTNIEPCLVKCKIGFKREGCLALCKTEFQASDQHEVWAIRAEDLQKKLPADYMAGNLLSLAFYFDDVTKPLLELPKKAEGE